MNVLVTGGAGQLGTDVAAVLAAQPHHTVTAPGRDRLDVADRDAVAAAVGGLLPDLVLHLGAWTDVDGCQTDPDRAWRVNALGTRHVAEAAAAVGAHLVYVSTDYVFDGAKAGPYHEWDIPDPRSVYGASKLAGEREVRERLPGATIVRTSWVCGRHGRNMVRTVLQLGRGTAPLRFVDDQRGCPTFTEDLAGRLCALGVGKRPGTFHVTNQGPTTWYRFARDVLAAAGGDPDRVEPISTDQLVPPRPAPRPANSVLDNAALRLAGEPLLPDHHEPLQRAVRHLLAS